jgi:hypothetical protein
VPAEAFGMNDRNPSILSTLFTLPAFVAVIASATACFELPELEALPPPLADLGGIDTWAGIESAGPPPSSANDGPPPSDDPFNPDAGGGPSGDGLGSPADPGLSQLLITEVHADPPGKDGGPDSPEYIELWNSGSEPVKLDGLRITAPSWQSLDAGKLGLSEFVLPAGGILLIYRWNTDVDPTLATQTTEGLVTRLGFLHNGGMRNAYGSVTIEAGNLPIDQVFYGAEPTEPTSGWNGAAVPAASAGKSLCRIDEFDHDDASDWAICAPNPGVLGAGSLPKPIAPGAIQIVEVYADPPVPSTQKKFYEFVEIVNVSEDSIELSGCRIGDHPDHDAPGVDPLEYLEGDGGCEASPTCLAPGYRAIIVGNAYVGETGDALVLATDDTTIAHGGLTKTEPAVLWDMNNTMVSSYRLWPDPAGEPLPHDHQSLHRVATDAEDEPQGWVVAPPSPGI